MTLKASVNFNVVDPNALYFNSGNTNEVRRNAQIKLIKTSTTYTLEILPQSRTVQGDVVIVQNNLADLDVGIVATTKTYAEVEKAKALNGNLVLTATPNPEATGGYEVFLQILNLQMNFISMSSSFYDFQTNALSDNQTQLLYFNYLLSDGKTPVRAWFTTGYSILLADTWSSDRLILVNNSFGSKIKQKKTFKISMPYEFLNLLPVGTYGFNLNMGMNPYTTPSLASQISTYDSIVSTQASTLYKTVVDINAVLTNQNSLHSLSTAQINQLKANRKLIFSIYQTFLKDVKKQYQAFLKDATVTPSEIVSIDQSIVGIDEALAALNLLIDAAALE